ncbi:MAG: hypothetical protein IJO01_01055 [Oscillospiraceae bacterium]|nr:hypothetical protein [Oscillospiraceae bacterium]
MKKALALVLALVLALSMAVSAFAAELVVLKPADKDADDKLVIDVVDGKDETVLYTLGEKATYYIALANEEYKDVAVSTNGVVSAELVKYDPEKMVVNGMDIFYDVTEKGVAVKEDLTYEAAKAEAEKLNNDGKVTYYGYKLATNVNIIKITVADNYSAAYKEGTLKITATLKKEPVSATLTVINDVTIFEYENVKWAAENYKADGTGAKLYCGELGYSDYATAENGYGKDYIPGDLRTADDAAVVSTTAFRAIAGKNLTVDCEKGLEVTLKEIKAGQKGVNFKHSDVAAYDKKGKAVEIGSGDAEYIAFGFKGDQVVLGDYTITADLGCTWYTLRETFGYKVEEDDIVSYYVLKNGKVVSEIKVDYMTADIDEEVVLTLNGSNSTLGEYKVVMEVPAVEGETNPNTGAESVVGVVAALAVVSVATAAAVSLKK